MKAAKVLPAAASARPETPPPSAPAEAAMAPTPTKEAQAMALEAQRARTRMAESLARWKGKSARLRRKRRGCERTLEVGDGEHLGARGKITDLETSLAEARNAQTVRELEDEGNGAESALREEAEKAKGEAGEAATAAAEKAAEEKVETASAAAASTRAELDTAKSRVASLETELEEVEAMRERLEARASGCRTRELEALERKTTATSEGRSGAAARADAAEERLAARRDTRRGACRGEG